MQADWDKLGKDYKNSRSVVIGDADCTVEQEFCSRYNVRGYPTLKVIKKDKKGAEDYNGGRDYASMKRYVEANLAGPECSLEDKEGCTKEERRILEESEYMKADERRQKINEMESDIQEKKSQIKQFEKDVKELTKKLGLFKLGGQKPDKVEQLLGDAEFREHCETRTCVLTFVPHILETGAAERKNLLAVLDAVFKKSKADGHPVGFMWLQGGDQFEIEEKLNLGFGFPAVIAINLKKERFGVHRGTFDKESLSGFLSSMMLGRVPLSPIPKGLPKWSKADAWDGKDGEPPVEEEL